MRAHSDGVTNAVLAMAIAFALPHINVSGFQENFLAYGFIYVAWSFTVFYWLGNASANRALTFGDNQLGESSLVSVLGFLPGLPSVVLVVVLLIVAVKGILSKKDGYQDCLRTESRGLSSRPSYSKLNPCRRT